MDPTPGQRDLASFYARNATYGSTARYRRATKAESYDLGFQYQGLPPHDAKGLALRKKAPRLQVPLFADAADALAGFVWSGGMPRLTVDATRDPLDPQDDEDCGPALTPGAAQRLTQFAAQVVRLGRLDRCALEFTRDAIVTTSVAVILGVCGGRLTTHVEPGKHCTPTFDPANPGELASLDIVYQHQREEPTVGGAVRARWYWYRRTLDASRDVVYLEVPVVPGRSPDWQEDPGATVEHGLGFVPARWIRTLPDSSDPVDGRPVIDPQLYPLIDEVNYALSQRAKAVSAVVEPQIIRKGVDEKGREVLAKSSDRVWDIGEKADVSLLDQKVEGIDASSAHTKDLTDRFRAAVKVVVADPSVFSGDISGRVLELIHGPMVRLAGRLRQDLGDDGFGRLVATALRLVTVVVGRGEAIYIPGAKRAAALLSAAQLSGPWLDPPITLHWPPLFPMSEADRTARVASTVAARDGELIAPETAVRATADLFGVADPVVELLAIEADEEVAPAPPPAVVPPAGPDRPSTSSATEPSAAGAD